MTEEANVISIDGTDYTESDLSDKQKYLVRHIKELQSEVAGKKFDLERLEAAMTHFTNMLIAEVKEKYQFENGEEFSSDVTK
jgi:chromosome segregation and condensation protein ScpB|tara:strand:- start:1116 stop:1361 length:246 start_codon:yes stop_codon:yes gene_type:complete